MKSFLSGKPSLSTPPLAAVVAKPSLTPGQTSTAKVTNPHSSAGAHSHGNHAPGAGPNIELIKEGGKVVRMVVTCTCGERIEVECLYPAGK